METDVESSESAALIADFISLEDRIFTLMDRLGKAGDQRLKSTPLYYHESRVEYINTLADSISANLESEINLLIASIEATDELYQEALNRDHEEKSIEYGLRLGQLKNVLGYSYENLTMTEQSRRPVLQTRVDRWSDFSFTRYAMGGMEFDELDRKYERLKQVEGYILTLDEMQEHMISEPESESTGIPSGNDDLQDNKIQSE
jgi:hypothetical protein